MMSCNSCPLVDKKVECWSPDSVSKEARLVLKEMYTEEEIMEELL